MKINEKKLNLVGFVTKDIDTENSNSQWAIATVECPDTSGDVITIDGIDYSTYHQPEQRYMKILAGHEFLLADGTPAIVGRIEEFRKVVVNVQGSMLNALAFRWSYACDGEGQLTDLAKKYKDLFDGGYIDSFSVGIMYYDPNTKSNKSGGINVNKSMLYEVSAVAVPAHPDANCIKAIKEALGTETTEEMAKQWNDRKALIMAKKEIVKDEPCGLSLNVEVSTLLSDIKKSIAESHKELATRLDVLESAIVVLTDAAKNQVLEQPPIDSVQDKKEALKTLERLNKFMDR